MNETHQEPRVGAGAADATGVVLSNLLEQTIALMGETAAIGDARAASAEVGPHEAAVRLRLASRLARIGGWVLAQEKGGDEARRRASSALAGAQTGELDPAGEIGPFREVSIRVDRLAAQAARLDRLMAPGHPAPALNGLAAAARAGA